MNWSCGLNACGIPAFLFSCSSPVGLLTHRNLTPRKMHPTWESFSGLRTPSRSGRWVRGDAPWSPARCQGQVLQQFASGAYPALGCVGQSRRHFCFSGSFPRCRLGGQVPWSGSKLYVLVPFTQRLASEADRLFHWVHLHKNTYGVTTKSPGPHSGRTQRSSSKWSETARRLRTIIYCSGAQTVGAPEPPEDLLKHILLGPPQSLEGWREAEHLHF